MSLNNTFSLLTSLTSYIFPYPVEQRKGSLTSYLEVVLDNGKLVLNTANVNYSYGSLHDIFYKTFQKLNIRDREIKNVLILGFGGGSIASLLIDTFHKNCTITGVEADEVVIELAKKHFNIERFKNLTIDKTDAYNFVSGCTQKFDLIAVDIFVEDETPEKFSDNQFLLAVSNLLTPCGIICYNRMLPSTKGGIQEVELTKSIDQLIGPNRILKYYTGGRTNWMFVHDRALVAPIYSYKSNTTKKTFPFKLPESI